MVHLVIWVMMTGKMPEHFLDHINGVPGDNRWVNLREATWEQNCWNQKVSVSNLLGVKGVRRRKGGGFDARISCHRVNHYLGRFDTMEAAKAAYEAKAVELFGNFACDSIHRRIGEVRG